MHWWSSSSSVSRSPASSAAMRADRISPGSVPRRRAVEQPVNEADHAGLEGGERLGREGRREELADARVVGRITKDHARGVMLVERACAELRAELHPLVGAPRVVVLVDGDDVVV